MNKEMFDKFLKHKKCYNRYYDNFGSNAIGVNWRRRWGYPRSKRRFFMDIQDSDYIESSFLWRLDDDAYWSKINDSWSTMCSIHRWMHNYSDEEIKKIYGKRVLNLYKIIVKVEINRNTRLI